MQGKSRMQFIVKPSPSGSRFLAAKELARFAPQFLYVVASVGLFTSGLLVGFLINWDTSCFSSIMSPTFSSQSHNWMDDQSSADLKSVSGVKKDQSFLVVLVFSAIHNKEKRDAIRRSWLLLGEGRLLKHYFIVGSLELEEYQLDDLRLENQQHKDLLVFPQVKDTYSGLTHKLLASLKWTHNRFNFSFLLKADDDSFVRLDKVFDELVLRKDATRLYWGYFVGSSQIKKGGQWTESSWFLCDRYLPYAVGGGYILSSDLVGFVAKNADYLQLYNSEDVSLGTWLSPLSINRIHDTRFDTWYKSRGCSDKYLITHKQSVRDMAAKFETLSTEGKLCRQEKYSDAHLYNWKLPPSQCCKQFEKSEKRK